VKALIFDLDGVLISTDQYHYKAWKRIADELGIYFDQGINNRLRGVSRRACLDILLENYRGPMLTQEDKERLTEEKNTLYRDMLTNLTPASVDSEVRSTLITLKSRGHKLAVGSSSRNTKFILEQTELTTLFDAISDGTNITHSKPHPEVFLKAAQMLGEESSNCIVIEDAAAGIDAAKAAGMTAVGIGEAAGYGHADICLQKISDLLSGADCLYLQGFPEIGESVGGGQRLCDSAEVSSNVSSE